MGTNLSPEEAKHMEDLHGAVHWAFLEDPDRPDALKPDERKKKPEEKPEQKLVKKPEHKPRQLVATPCVPETVTVTVTSTIDVEPVTMIARDQVTPLPDTPSKDNNDAKYLKLLQSFLGAMQTSPTTIPQRMGRRDLSEDPRLFLNEHELGEYLEKIRELDYKDPIGGVTGPPPNAVYDLELKELNAWLENKKIEPPSVDHLPISQRPFYAPFFKSATTTEAYQPYLPTGTPQAKSEGKAMPLVVRAPPRLMYPAFYVNTEPPKSKATATATVKSKAKGKIEARATPLGARDPPSVEAPLLLVSTEESSIATPTPTAVPERVVVPKEKTVLYGPAWVKDRKLPTFAIEKDYTDRKEFDTTEMDPEIAAKINQAINIGKEAGSPVISPDEEMISSDKKAIRGGYTDEKEFDVGKMDPEYLAKMEQAVNTGKGAGSLVISPDKKIISAYKRATREGDNKEKKIMTGGDELDNERIAEIANELSTFKKILDGVATGMAGPLGIPRDKTIVHARRNEECTSPICRLDRESLGVVLICLFILGAIIVVIGLIFVMYYVPKGWRKLTKKLMRMRGGKVAAAAAQEQEFKIMVRESEEAVTRPKDVHMV
jgi:hypothetical protein